ncbi:hypothetical protein PRIPAC_96085 [Pristionchus pacificus]|uniref:Uncharacterized protein n=1 Tax=Pristionchus pacificus TaxID=54126 RepID=A0A2A6B2H5_PRIPA|nr:hypothetical protein PRIPAC_96085 [Pristionchus pacificus]|eukprot:PDM60069.1 hypothetical protein PRIPAC_49355 [Pristionchus pacificus]
MTSRMAGAGKTTRKKRADEWTPRVRSPSPVYLPVESLAELRDELVDRERQKSKRPPDFAKVARIQAEYSLELERRKNAVEPPADRSNCITELRERRDERTDRFEDGEILESWEESVWKKPDTEDEADDSEEDIELIENPSSTVPTDSADPSDASITPGYENPPIIKYNLNCHLDGSLHERIPPAPALSPVHSSLSVESLLNTAPPLAAIDGPVQEGPPRPSLERTPSPTRSSASHEDTTKGRRKGGTMRGPRGPKEPKRPRYWWCQVKLTVYDYVYFDPSWNEPVIMVPYNLNIDRTIELAEIREKIAHILSRHGVN